MVVGSVAQAGGDALPPVVADTQSPCYGDGAAHPDEDALVGCAEGLFIAGVSFGVAIG